MAKSKIQFQKGYSLFEFLKDYGTEAQCENALFTWRFPNGFVCPECANKTCCRLRRRPRVWQCNHCRHQMSLTGNTIFANTKLPLTKWFLAMHLLSQTKTGLSAMELKRQLGVKYDTAWMLKHKLLQAMKESDDKQPISGIIQLDDVYWGGERRGGKRGRGDYRVITQPHQQANEANGEGCMPAELVAIVGIDVVFNPRSEQHGEG